MDLVSAFSEAGDLKRPLIALIVGAMNHHS